MKAKRITKPLKKTKAKRTVKTHKRKRRKISMYQETLLLLQKSQAECRELVQSNLELVHTAFQAVVDRDAVRKKIEEMEKIQGKLFYEQQSKE